MTKTIPLGTGLGIEFEPVVLYILQSSTGSPVETFTDKD